MSKPHHYFVKGQKTTTKNAHATHKYRWSKEIPITILRKLQKENNGKLVLESNGRSKNDRNLSFKPLFIQHCLHKN